MANNPTEPKKDWSLAEWITNFIQDDILYYEEGLYDDIFDDTIGDRPGGGDEAYDEANVELLFIFGLSMALVGLLYYRQMRQQENRREAERMELERRGGQAQQQGGQAQGQGQAQQDRGVFPGPGEPEFANWVAGGVGH